MFALLLALNNAAYAFCGTYVGQAGAELYNNASQVVFVRQGTTTTLTLANDFQGDVTDFALVIPVPELLSAEDVTTVDSALFAVLDRYSAPRLVSYSCEDFQSGYGYGGDSATSDDSGGGDGGGSASTVVIQAAFSAGEYDFVVLSAEESEALLSWLNDNGYTVSETAGDLLQEYIDAGSYFLAARVSLEMVPPNASFLSPIRIRYESEVMSLPIRLGTANAQGAQDLLIYGINDWDQGTLHIANYPEVGVVDECMLSDGASVGFSTFWADRLDTVFGDQAAWMLEYAWSAGSCDPCPDGMSGLDDATTTALGYSGPASGAAFSRLHMRYSPEQATQDLSLYHSGYFGYYGGYGFTQIRYIEWNPEVAAYFDACEPGTISWDEVGDCVDSGPEDKIAVCECSSGARFAWGPLGALGLLVLRRRR